MGIIGQWDGGSMAVWENDDWLWGVWWLYVVGRAAVVADCTLTAGWLGVVSDDAAVVIGGKLDWISGTPEQERSRRICESLGVDDWNPGEPPRQLHLSSLLEL